MVQQASNQNYRDSDGLNEFQLVHALITQSLNKCHQESVDENDNAITIKESNSQNNIISDVFQTFNTTQKKRVFPRYVKHFLSQFRRSKEYISNPTSEVLIETPSNRSTVARHASLHSLPPSGENGRKELRRSLSSNVHKKVLHFESCANLNTDQVCDRVPPITPPPQRSPGVEKCAGGIYYPPASPSSPTKMEEDSEPQNLTPEPPRQPQVLTGRNLKRVPSERFQKMRRKVQKLMVIEHPVESDDRDTSYRPQEQDEASFLRSLRIPAPSHIQKDSSQQPCDILRLPDHIITQIFSHLDTKSLAAAKCCCTDFKFIIYTFDIRGSDSKWRTDERYIDDPCKQCRHQFERGDTTMCSYHPKRYYSDIPYGRSYWMCCFQYHRSAPGCKFGLHDNDWST